MTKKSTRCIALIYNYKQNRISGKILYSVLIYFLPL